MTDFNAHAFAFSYDALGQAVQTPGAVFPYDAFGNMAGFYSTSGYWSNQWVPFQGRALADVAGGETFYHRNGLGSVTFTTTTSGAYYEEYVYYPWGQIWANPVGRVWEERFASMARLDYNDANYATPNRSYEEGLGRWLSPDPLAGDITNPQSLNRYAYVLNNPTTLTDPTGLIVVNMNPSDPCAYVSTGVGDASCGALPGLWDSGVPIWPDGGGGGGGGGGGKTHS